ncbi:MAG: DUF4388 domain-containing protein, partial [Planctomycetota bacterium]
MPFAGNLRTLPLPDVLQTLNNIKATGVLRLTSHAGSRDVVFQQGEIIGVGFLDKDGRDDLTLRLALLGIETDVGEWLKGVTWYWTAMQARTWSQRQDVDELIHQQAREQLHNLFVWNNADFSFEDAGPGKAVANDMVARCLERPLAIDTATLLLEAARQQDEWAEVRTRIRTEAGVAAMGSAPVLEQIAADAGDDAAAPQSAIEEQTYHLHLEGEWRGPYQRSQIIAMVKAGSVTGEVWSYDPRNQERQTLDQLLGGTELRRVSAQDIDALQQAVKAAEARLIEERTARQTDLAELRGLASEILRLSRDQGQHDPATAAVIERLSEAISGDDPSLIVLSSETVVVSLVHHLRGLSAVGLEQARTQTASLAERISEIEGRAASERAALEAQVSVAEQRADAERDQAAQMRARLAAAAEHVTQLDQDLQRSRRDSSRVSTERIVAGQGSSSDSPTPVVDETHELQRLRVEHTRLLNDVAVLQAQLDEDRARHQAELEASRAVAAALGEHASGTERSAPSSTETHLSAEVERLRQMLADALRRAESGSAIRAAITARDLAASERDAARSDSERLRHDLHAARSDNTHQAELNQRLVATEQRAS